MAYPSISSSVTSFNEGTTGHAITLPGGMNIGDLLIVFFTCNGDGVNINWNSSLSGVGWNELDEYSSIGNSAAIYYKIVDGYDYLSITTDSSVNSTAIAYHIINASNAGPISSYYGTGGTNANPPSITPVNGTQDYLFIVYAGIEGTVVASAAPTGFSGLTTLAGITGSSSSSAAYRQYNTGVAYNPEAFTSTSANYVTFTVCISPVTVDGIGSGVIAYYDIN
jgi:hypothetical protein